MGYETKFNISLYGEITEDRLKELDDIIVRISAELKRVDVDRDDVQREDVDYYYFLEDLEEGYNKYSHGWHFEVNAVVESNMIKFAKILPSETKMLVETSGEEIGDMTIGYIYNNEYKEQINYSCIRVIPWFMKNKIQIISIDDWSVLYIDGILAEQGHDLETSDVIKILIDRELNMGDYEFDSTYIDEERLGVNFELQAWGGNFPVKLTDFTDIIKL